MKPGRVRVAMHREQVQVEALEIQVASIVYRYWQLPGHAGRRLIRLIKTSRSQRATIFRHQITLGTVQLPTLQGWREADLKHSFTTILTPKFVMDMLGDFRAMGSLSVDDQRIIAEHVLKTVDALGMWKAVN